MLQPFLLMTPATGSAFSLQRMAAHPGLFIGGMMMGRLTTGIN